MKSLTILIFGLINTQNTFATDQIVDFRGRYSCDVSYMSENGAHYSHIGYQKLKVNQKQIGNKVIFHFNYRNSLGGKSWYLADVVSLQGKSTVQFAGGWFEKLSSGGLSLFYDVGRSPNRTRYHKFCMPTVEPGP